MKRSILLPILLLLIYPSWGTRIEQVISFDSPGNATVRLRLSGFDEANLTLLWPVSVESVRWFQDPSELRIENGEPMRILVPLNDCGEANVTFGVDLDCELDEETVFPLARSEGNRTNSTLRVELPRNWTALGHGRFEKTYDMGSGRIVMVWEDASKPCSAILTVPGDPNSRLVKQMRWMIFKGYVYLSFVIALLVLTGIIIWRMVEG